MQLSRRPSATRSHRDNPLALRRNRRLAFEMLSRLDVTSKACRAQHAGGRGRLRHRICTHGSPGSGPKTIQFFMFPLKIFSWDVASKGHEDKESFASLCIAP